MRLGMNIIINTVLLQCATLSPAVFDGPGGVGKAVLDVPGGVGEAVPACGDNEICMDTCSIR